MYWSDQMKLFFRNTAFIAIIAVFLYGCNDSKNQTTSTTVEGEVYFDIKGFFSDEIDYLNKQSPEISKTVAKDNNSESKTIKINDWEIELNSFYNIDFNKPVYQGQFEVINDGKETTYLAKNDKTDIQSVKITKNEDGEVESITVSKSVKNMLYSTEEILEYKKNKSYNIEKNQTILLLGNNHYLIRGEF